MPRTTITEANIHLYEDPVVKLKRFKKLIGRSRREVGSGRSDGHLATVPASTALCVAPPDAKFGAPFTPDGREYTDPQLVHLINEVKDYQLTHGSLLKLVHYETESFVSARPVGVSLVPTPFPRRCFNEAAQLQHWYNELYVRVASDPLWLYGVLQPILEHDNFVAALWDIWVEVRDAGALSNIVCGLFRSDYMVHQHTPGEDVSLKQVEMNTFSCAGACHAERVASMHQHISRTRNQSKDALPESKNAQSVVDLLHEAHTLYKPRSQRMLCVLMTVQPFNFNIADERPIEYGLWEKNTACYRCQWQDVLLQTTLTEDRTLLFSPAFGEEQLEISVVYYRGGYDAAEYREQSWQTRLRLEMSRAIKCPDILTHLTTFKAVQQALTLPGAVERFLPADKASKIRETFMSIQKLDNSQACHKSRAIATNSKRAEKYVLKPNLEGGGHNIYRSAIPKFLRSIPQEQWQKYVLMRVIETPTTVGTLMMVGGLYHGDVVSELGVLGTCLWERGDFDSEKGDWMEVKILTNNFAGWTFKTKPSQMDEMSVVKGFGVFDCPSLIE